MSATERLRDGQAFGRYQIVRLIGEGGMGAVYEALHPALRRRFAIKTLLPAIAQNEEARLRFLREGEAASSINHPHVVAVSDVGTEDGVPYLVMELLEGQTLGDLLAQRGSLGVEEAVALLLPVISAVATGHDRGVIHRDLKPQNIFLARGPWGDQIPKVLDFGVSKLTGEDNAAITRTLTVLGTAAYMSPEQARGAKRVDFPSDQYALGLILYEMLTGRRAHPGENSLEILHNVASGVIRPARELKPDLPDDLDVVLTRMLAANPAERFRSLHDAGRALLRFADDRTRISLANAFGSGGPGASRPGDTLVGARADGAAPSPAPAAAPSGSPSNPASNPSSNPSSGSRPGGTLQLPAALAGLPDTTSREAGSEAPSIRAARRQRSTFKLKGGLGATGAGVAVLVLAGAIIWWITAGKSTAPSSPAAFAESRGAAPGPGAIPPSTRSRSISTVPAEEPPAPEAPAPPTTPFEIRAVPPEAEIELDDMPPTKGRLELVLPLAGSAHEIRVSAKGYEPKVVSFGPHDQPPAEIRLEPEPARPPTPSSSAERPTGPGVTATSRPGELGPLSRPARAPRPPATSSSSRPTRATQSPAAREATGLPKRGSNNALILE